MRVRALPALAVVTGLLLGCSAEPSSEREPEARPTATTSQPRDPAAPPSQTPSATPAALPDVPDPDRPAVLARQLEHALATLRSADAATGDVRRAAEFHQLAVRALAHRPPTAARAVTGRMAGQEAAIASAGIRAARDLDALTEPQPRLPQWRIVAPPPPEELLGHYRAAQRHFDVPWHYLAAIHLVETRMGRIRGVSSAGARGPMQFLPTTWAMYGAGGDITDPRDAVLAAARLLVANGAPDDMAEALWHYNPSDHYVRAVSEYAETMRRAEWTYLGYWHWRVLYKHVRGTYDLPIGYPATRPVAVTER